MLKEWREYPRVVWSHEIYAPLTNEQPQLMGKVVFDSKRGRCIAVQQYSLPHPNSPQKEEKWVAAEPIPWVEGGFDNIIRESDQQIKIGCMGVFHHISLLWEISPY